MKFHPFSILIDATKFQSSQLIFEDQLPLNDVYSSEISDCRVRP